MYNKSDITEVVLHRYVDFSGKDHALGKVFTPGFNYLEKFWYLSSDMKRVYLDPENLVEVKRVDKRLGKPAVVYYSDKKNPSIKRYTATLDIAGADRSVSGYCLTQENANTRARRQLAKKTKMSFKDLNGWIKIHPSTFKVTLTDNY